MSVREEEPLWTTGRRTAHTELFEAEYAKQLERIARIRSEVSAALAVVEEPVEPPQRSTPTRRMTVRWDSAPDDFDPWPAPTMPAVTLVVSATTPRTVPARAGRRDALVRRVWEMRRGWDLRRAWLLVVGAVATVVAVLLAVWPQQPPDSNVFRVTDRPNGIVAGGGRVWLAGAGMLSVLDGDTGRLVAWPPATGGARVALDARFAWVTDARRGVLVRVARKGVDSPRTIRIHRGVADVVVTQGIVWTASPVDGTLRLLDPATGRVRSIEAGARPVALAADAARVVAADAAGTLLRFDARSRRPVGAPILLGGAPVDVALAGDQVWVADSGSGTVRAVDFVSGRVHPPERVCRGPVAVAADRAAVFVLCRGDRTLVQLDPRTGDVRSRVAVAYVPTAIAVDSRHVWIAAETNEVIRVAR